jgi:hypothetical protein
MWTVEFHLSTKPDVVTHEEIQSKKPDGNTRIYYITSKQLASGKHDHPTRNIIGIILRTTMTNTSNF